MTPRIKADQFSGWTGSVFGAHTGPIWVLGRRRPWDVQRRVEHHRLLRWLSCLAQADSIIATSGVKPRECATIY